MMTIEQLKEILKTRMSTGNPTEKSLIYEIYRIVGEQETEIDELKVENEKLKAQLEEVDC